MPSNMTYSHETVVLEAETFSGCEFRDCRLIYAGGEPGLGIEVNTLRPRVRR